MEKKWKKNEKRKKREREGKGYSGGDIQREIYTEVKKCHVCGAGQQRGKQNVGFPCRFLVSYLYLIPFSFSLIGLNAPPCLLVCRYHYVWNLGFAFTAKGRL